jgi:hypothetical protein
LREMENAYDAHSICMVWLKDDPRLDPLRSEPRFQAILQGMSFSAVARWAVLVAAPRPSRLSFPLSSRPCENREGG